MQILILSLFCLGFVYSDYKEFDIKEAEIVGRLFSIEGTRNLISYPPEKQSRRVFSCPKLKPSPEVPKSVHKLRPGDIKVVGALGDSLTAARGASGSVVGLLIDYRGLSWSIGGDERYEEYGTLPNILRKYNKNVYGFSTGVGDRDKSTSRFNVARSGDESRHLVEQANMLVARMLEDPNIDFENDWKVITVFIGGNDLCDYCKDKKEYTIANYKANLQAALDILQANIPRAFVNLVEVLNIEITEELARGPLCQAIHIYACDCAANPKTKAAEKYVSHLKFGFQQAAVDLVNSGRYDDRDDFTVVLQPFYRETYLPRTKTGEVDYTYFARDCFHYSAKGHRAAAEALWNNMIEPVGSKRIQWTPGEAIECPTEDSPYLYTVKNSKK